MKVEVLKKFKDKHTGKIYEVGDIITVSKERYKEILETDKFVEEVKKATSEEAAAESDDGAADDATE